MSITFRKYVREHSDPTRHEDAAQFATIDKKDQRARFERAKHDASVAAKLDGTDFSDLDQFEVNATEAAAVAEAPAPETLSNAEVNAAITFLPSQPTGEPLLPADTF